MPKKSSSAVTAASQSCRRRASRWVVHLQRPRPTATSRMVSVDPPRGAAAAVPSRDPPPRWIPAETAGATATSSGTVDAASGRDGVLRRGSSCETRAESADTEKRTREWLYAVFFLLTMSQALPLTAIQVLLNRDLGLAERPEQVNKYFAVEFSASMLKPAYALLSDLCPIFGRRRVPYMALGAFAYAVALQFYARVDSVDALYAAGVSSVVVFAVCETGADGALVQLSGGDSKKAMRVQAAGMLMRSAGSFTATALSIPLLALTDARTVVSLAGVFALAAAAAACAVPEPKREGPERGTRYAFRRVPTRDLGEGDDRDDRGGLLEGDAEDAEDARGRTTPRRRRRDDDAGAFGFSAAGARSAARAALAPFAPCFTPRVATCAVFLFAYRLPPTSLVTFTTFAYAQFTLPAWGYSVMLLLSMLGGILATAGYRRAAAAEYAHAPGLAFSFTLKTSFAMGAAVNAVCGLARLLVVDAWDGSREPSAAPLVPLAISNVVASGGLMFGYMPILALAAKIAPPGVEAFGFASMLFVSDLATTAGSALAASLTEAMELGSGADRSWSNLPSFIWMCALFKFAPLALLPFVDARDGAEDATGASYREETEEENER